jgi:hypothetical protein
MALAYSLVLVQGTLFDLNRRDAVQLAQREADRKFEQLAVEHRLTQVTRNPEPRVLTHQELQQEFPGQFDFDSDIIALYFTAEIT